MEKRKLLALCDSPTAQTGFGRVASNLLGHWQESGFFDEIWIWSIGYRGMPTPHLPYYQIPAAPNPESPVWWTTENLQLFMNQATRTTDPFTHVWMMHDTFTLRPLAEPLRQMSQLRAKGSVLPKSFLYFPVDCALRRDWLRVIESVDVPVSYTEWGKQTASDCFSESLKEAGVKGKQLRGAVEHFEDQVYVAPHGVDTSVYHPLPEERRQQIRDERYGGLVKPDDFLLVNVNAHQKRKGIFQTLETFAELRRQDRDVIRRDRYKLYLHMPQENKAEGTSLPVMAEALGLPTDCVLYGDAYFHGGYPAQPESTLNEIYNSADLVITTTHGEGWGLTITEAMAAGRPVAAPDHTAMTDYFDDNAGIALPADRHIILPADNNRPRPVVDPERAANYILEAIEAGSLPALGNAARDRMLSPKYDWKLIADQWLEWFA